MLDIAWTEILIIAMVAIVVVGPRELPRMLRAVGTFMGQVRRTAGEFQRQFNDALREAELDDVKRGFDSVRNANPLNKIKDDLNPLKQAGDSVRKAVEDPGAPRPPKAKAGQSAERQATKAATTAGTEGTTPSGASGSTEEATMGAETKPSSAAGPKHQGARAKPPAKAAGTKPGSGGPGKSAAARSEAE